MSEQEPPKAFADALNALHGCVQKPGYIRQRWVRGRFGEGFRAGQRAQAEKDAEIAEEEERLALHKQSARWIATRIRAAAPKGGE